MAHLQSTAILARLRTFTISPTRDYTGDLLRVHTPSYVNTVLQSCQDTDRGRDIRQQLSQHGDVFITPDTAEAALMAAAAAVELTEHILDGDSGIQRAFSLCRPPGHHADMSSAKGFCIFNNIAVAAALSLDTHHLSRVAVVDWDIHHGNGCQDIFEADPRVLHISVHKHVYRSVEGEVAQAGEGAMAGCVGVGEGRGYNVNVPLGAGKAGGGMGDADYAAVFEHIVLPVLQEFNPEMVFIAAGFDAGVGDVSLPIGGYSVSPEGFGMMSTALRHCAGEAGRGRILACLEGGYNTPGLCLSVEAVIRSMLEPATVEAGAHGLIHGNAGTGEEGGQYTPEYSPAAERAVASWLRCGEGCDPDTKRVIEEVKAELQPFWTCFQRIG